MRTLILAAAAAALLAGPALTTSAAAAPPASAKPATKGTSKMSACAGQWRGMSAGDKGKYNDKAKGMKSKKGGSLSGYNVWTSECMKK